jgi:hypothetical protein
MDSKKKKIFLYGGIAITVALIGVGIYFVMSKKSSPTPVRSAPPVNVISTNVGDLVLENGMNVQLATGTQKPTPIAFKQVTDGTDQYTAITTADGSKYIGIDIKKYVYQFTYPVVYTDSFAVNNNDVVSLMFNNGQVQFMYPDKQQQQLKYSFGTAKATGNVATSVYFTTPTNYPDDNLNINVKSM